MKDRPLEIEMTLSEELLRIFFPLLQQGVTIEVRVGFTIKQMLTEQFGIPAEYLSSRVTTVFLNSKAVDDIATAKIHDHATLALSGAMPGLVGATMRSGGFYAAMRDAMTYRNEGEFTQDQGRIRLKLFNLLLQELGPRFLRWGILLESKQLRDLLAVQPMGFRPSGCLIDGRPVANGLDEALKKDQPVKLKVLVGES